jgi:hypothetical protein
MTREIIHTDQAPQAIGTYSQAVRCGNTVYLSGQIPLAPETMELVQGDAAGGGQGGRRRFVGCGQIEYFPHGPGKLSYS